MTRFAFNAGSFWNTPLPVDAPVDPESDTMIASLAAKNKWPYLSLGTGIWAMPVYRSQPEDPLVTIEPERFGPTVTFRLPTDARPMQTNDGAMVVIDRTTGQDVSFFEFRYDDGEPKATDITRYFLRSEGLHEDAGGTPGNLGHRGIPGAVSMLTKRDLKQGVNRRLKIAIPGTADWHVFPMVGDEGDKGGIIGEGMILRLKPDVVLPAPSLDTAFLALALRDYGVVIGDNGGVATLKAERGLDLPPYALQAFGWEAYEVVDRSWNQGWEQM